MENHDEHHHPPYKFIFMILIICTGMSWIADELKTSFPGPGWLAVTVLAISTAKASCVMMYFMHLKFERHWKYVLLGPTFILAIGLPLALLPDIAVHYYDVDVPQNPIEEKEAGNYHGEVEAAGLGVAVKH